MEPSPGPLLEAIELRKSFGRREALRGITLEARPGELVACIGPNGAGKTTLLTILAGVQPADSGTVHRPERGVGWVPQRAALYGKLSVAENLSLFARLERVPDVGAAVERMLSQTGLTDRAADPVARLSDGNRQRVNIALGLVADPSLLLLDEPSAALDPRQREVLWSFVRDLASAGSGVVYATHVVAEAERYADRVLVLANGERLFWGTPGELRERVGNPAGGDGSFEEAFIAFLGDRGR
jgi:ABC-2 type transport system ATP-binding protein